ncbi:ATP-dependent DNA helicase PIF1-like, partial [Aphis craccivora]
MLDGGRTAYSALKLPLNVQVIKNPTCNISRNSAMEKVLQQTAIILLNECTMTHKKSLEAIHRTMQDLHGNRNIFGGALILLSGDFRQTLPVILRSIPADEINACLKSSFMWRNVRKLTLNINMHVQLQNDLSADRFSKQLLEIGNGKVQIDNTNDLINMPFEFKRLQFPVRLSFAMSINKAQGQTLQVCCLNLEESCFLRTGNVACSRVGTPNCLFVYAPNGQTKNIVYSNVLD